MCNGSCGVRILWLIFWNEYVLMFLVFLIYDVGIWLLVFFWMLNICYEFVLGLVVWFYYLCYDDCVGGFWWNICVLCVDVCVIGYEM